MRALILVCLGSFALLGLSAAAELPVDTPADHLQLSHPPTAARGFERGIYDGDMRTRVELTTRPCIFHSHNSPEPGSSLPSHLFEQRVSQGIHGASELTVACEAMGELLQPHECGRVFIGGHNDSDSVGVFDLVQLYPREGADLVAWQRKLSQGMSQTEARRLILDPKGPCVPNPGDARVFFAVFECVSRLIDKTDPLHALVFSSCGPLTHAVLAQGHPERHGLGQEVCGQLLSNAIDERIIYARGEDGSAQALGAYDTTAFGHRWIQPRR